jgi:hypothetical protein
MLSKRDLNRRIINDPYDIRIMIGPARGTSF